MYIYIHIYIYIRIIHTFMYMSCTYTRSSCKREATLTLLQSQAVCAKSSRPRGPSLEAPISVTVESAMNCRTVSECAIW